MQTTSRAALWLLVFSLAIASLSAVAQVVIATVPAGGYPNAVAVNPVTNKIYVANTCGNDPTCSTYYGTVTVIDGKTLNTSTIAVGIAPNAVAVNPATNKIYVANICGNDPTCNTLNETVTVIDGTTLSTVTLTVGFDAGFFYLPGALAVNPVTNKIYVVAPCGNDHTCMSNGTVTVIDANNNNMTTPITVGMDPQAVAVNTTTNNVGGMNWGLIYVTNSGSNSVTVIDGKNNSVAGNPVPVGTSPSGLAINEVTNQIYVANSSAGTVTVIDGTTNDTTTVNLGASAPFGIAANPVTNQIYVANENSGTVTVIDGTTFFANVTVGAAPLTVGVDAVTNNIYVGNTGSNTVTVINGATNSTTTVPVGSQSAYTFGMAVNSVDNRIYVTNPSIGSSGGSVSVIAGASSTALQFVAITPCRVVDTRQQNGEFGGPAIQGGVPRSFPLPQNPACNIPSSAAAYSLNVTVVPTTTLGYLTIWPTAEDQPVVSTMNSLDGRIKANAAIVPAGYQGAVSVYVTDTTNVVLDIDGYFAPVSGSTLVFYPLTPCRVADTRSSNFPQGLGTPHLSAQTQRDFPVLSSTCNIPSTAQAYSLNFTAIPWPPGSGLPLGYLEVWPKNQMPQNPVSTLNNPTGTIVANAAIVPAGTGGEITAYPSDNTDLVIDVNGYFAPVGLGGLSLYTGAPCRVLDTRQSGGAFSGQLTPAIDVVNSSCGVPSTVLGYVFNATVVPRGSLGYLTLWPDGEDQPVVSTLNAVDGAITSNMAILQNFDGATDAYAAGTTQLIIDISSYFAP
jgi:YVTN family beta-propeller protein